jgi:hypothetical protein
MTYPDALKLAALAGTLAANRSMQKAGRERQIEADINAACGAFNLTLEEMGFHVTDEVPC